MNKCDNYIISEIYIKEEDLNRDIRIINSFEQFKKERILKIEMMIIKMKMKKKL